MASRAALRWPALVCATVLLFGGCNSPDAVAPEHARPLAPERPSFNAITGAVASPTTLTAWSVTPTSQPYDNSSEYELRFSFVGYLAAHMEPRIGAMIAPPTAAERTLPARIRTGSGDYIHVEICSRRYQAFIYIGCYGSGSADFTAGDNGVAKAVTFFPDYHVPNTGATITMTLSWTPLNSQPTAVYVSTPNPELYAGGPAQEMISSATDAANQSIPGLPITWSSSDNSIFTVDANGVVTPVGAGTGTLTATVSGVSGSSSIVVYAVQPLLNDIIGPSTVDPGWEATWSSNARGGIPPYTYVWRINGTVMQQGQGTDYAYFAYTNQGTDFTVNVTVIDYRGVAVGKSIGVSVGSSCAPNCY